MNHLSNASTDAAELRRRAEARARERQLNQKPGIGEPQPSSDPRRLVQELQVHQIELEMQNAELHEARDRMESLLEKYTDLYDFAPVGYFSLDEQGRILEANLTGAALLGVDRSRLINQRLPRFLVPASQPIFLTFLERVFAGRTGRQFCEAALLRENAAAFWADFHGTSATSLSGPRKWCRVAISDITPLKQAQEAQRRMEALAVANQKLKREVLRRQTVEETLKKSEQDQSQLLERSRQMQEDLRHLSRQLLLAQEEERKKISRELHDVIAQTLTTINVRLATLKKEAALSTKGLDRNIARTQELVAHSVDIVHRFARELRPAVLDDLGLIPALHTFLKHFRAETRIQVRLAAFPAVEQVNGDKRTVLYRVAQESLTNVARHAQASRVEVTIRKLAAAVCMTIKDDGKGFQTQRVSHTKKAKRLGLLGMRERLEMVGGNFNITSVPGKGTTVIARVPLMNRPPGGCSSDSNPVR